MLIEIPQISEHINKVIYYQNEIKKLNIIEKLREKMHYFKNSGMKNPFEELPFCNLHGLKYLGTN